MARGKYIATALLVLAGAVSFYFLWRPDAAAPIVGVVRTTEIRIAPYRLDPARARYENFAERTYVSVFSDDVPGQVVELRSELFGAAADGGPVEMVLGESLIFVDRR